MRPRHTTKNVLMTRGLPAQTAEQPAYLNPSLPAEQRAMDLVQRIATSKHHGVHSGPESTRHAAYVKVSKHDEVDTYVPAFRATVTEGKAGSVMCA